MTLLYKSIRHCIVRMFHLIPFAHSKIQMDITDNHLCFVLLHIGHRFLWGMGYCNNPAQYLPDKNSLPDMGYLQILLDSKIQLDILYTLLGQID